MVTVHVTKTLIVKNAEISRTVRIVKNVCMAITEKLSMVVTAMVGYLILRMPNFITIKTNSVFALSLRVQWSGGRLSHGNRTVFLQN